MIFLIPETWASSIMYWITGLSTNGQSSFGTALLRGKNLVPGPAMGIIAFFYWHILENSNLNSSTIFSGVGSVLYIKAK